MPSYHYKASTTDGKLVEGTMEIGATVTVYFDGTENGFEQIYKVKIEPPGTPSPK